MYAVVWVILFNRRSAAPLYAALVASLTEANQMPSGLLELPTEAARIESFRNYIRQNFVKKTLTAKVVAALARCNVSKLSISELSKAKWNPALVQAIENKQASDEPVYTDVPPLSEYVIDSPSDEEAPALPPSVVGKRGVSSSAASTPPARKGGRYAKSSPAAVATASSAVSYAPPAASATAHTDDYGRSRVTDDNVIQVVAMLKAVNERLDAARAAFEKLSDRFQQQY